MERRPTRLACILALSILLALWVGGGGCDYGPLFPDLQPEGIPKDLLEGRTDSWELDDDLLALSDPTVYIDFVALTDVEPPAVNADATVYRLELKNLIPDGAFAQGAAEVLTLGTEHQGWSYYDAYGYALGLHELVDSGRTINARTLHYRTNSNADRLDYDVRDGEWGSTDGFLEDGVYTIRFDFRAGTQPIVFEFRDEANSINRWITYSGPGGEPGGTFDNLLEFPTAAVIDDFPSIRPRLGSTVYYFTFGSIEDAFSVPQEAYIDNFRLVRTDIAPRVVLDIPYRIATASAAGAEADLLLISGEYRFRVWVRDDPEAETDAAPNRYHARGLTLHLTGGGLGDDYTGGTSTFYETLARPAEGWPDWTLIELRIPTEEPIQITPPADLDSFVMTLGIAPTDYHYNAGREFDVGALLFAAPTLEFVTGIPETTTE